MEEESWSTITEEEPVVEDQPVEESILDVGYQAPAQPAINGAVIVFEGVDLKFETVNGNTELKGTSGSLLLKNNVFVGKGGKFDWTIAGYGPDEVFVDFKEYNFRVISASLSAEGVTLSYPAKTDQKVDGIFEFFSLTDNPEIMQCWAPLPRLEPGIQVMDDRFVDGKTFVEPLAIILYDRPTYFLAMVEQYSLSAEAFEYWNQVKKQQQNTGSIFDSTPAQIKGNIYRTDNPAEVALGYFGASAVTRDSVLFQRFKASGLVSPTRPKDVIPGDCRFQEPNATNIKPPGFI